MVTAVKILLCILASLWIFGFIACFRGGLHINHGDESWKDERWEKIYYKVIVPAEAVCLIALIIFAVILLRR